MTIKMRNIYKKYDQNYVLKDLSLDLNRGEIVGLVGKNGAGKTTLMKILCGNIVDFEGVVSYPASSSNRPLGFLIENPKFYPNKTGLANLQFFAQLFASKGAGQIEKIIKALDMEAYIAQKSRKYSLGMKQRLGLAIALLGEPDFLVLDEPTNGMDPDGIEEILEYLKYLAQEKQLGIFISSHQLDHIQKVSDFILVIDAGETVKSIDKDELVGAKQVTIVVDNKDIGPTKLILAREGIDFDLKNNALTFQANELSPILTKLSTAKIVLQDIQIKEQTLKEFYFNRKGGK